MTWIGRSASATPAARAEALEPCADEMQGVFGRVEQDGPAPRRTEAAQTRDAGGDGDAMSARETSCRTSARRRRCRRPRRPRGPSMSQRSAPGEQTGRSHARDTGKPVIARGPPAAAVGRGVVGAGAKRSRKRALVELRGLALGAGEQEFVRVGHERAVIAAGVLDEGVDEPGVRSRGLPAWRRRAAGTAPARRARRARGGVSRGGGCRAAAGRSSRRRSWSRRSPARTTVRMTRARRGRRSRAGAARPDTAVRTSCAFVDEEHRAHSAVVDVREPRVAQRLGAGPAIGG